MTKFSINRILLVVGLSGLLACQQAPPNVSSAPNTRSSSYSGVWDPSHVAPRDLSQDEAAGGHTLHKHVGGTDEELLERLDRERNISAASTYSDRATAERVVGAAIAQSQDRIQRWLNRTGGHPNLVLDYDSDQPIGRTITRGERRARPCSHALVVLKYKPPAGYYVLTSYPECR